jgi:hypothetical protein
MFIWTFLLRITHTIISQNTADFSWFTLYINSLKLSVPNQTWHECTATYNQVLFVSIYVCVVFYYLPYITVTYGIQVMQDTRTSLSSTSSLCSSLNVRDQVSHPYKTRDKIIVLGILVSIFWIACVKTKGFRLSGCRHCVSWIHLALRLKKEPSYTSTPPLGLRGMF